MLMRRLRVLRGAKKLPSAAKFKDDSSKFLRLAGSSTLGRQAQPPQQLLSHHR